MPVSEAADNGDVSHVETDGDRVAMTDRAPARLKVVGGIFAVVGVITVIDATGPQPDTSTWDVAWNIAIAFLLIVIGTGLCLNDRWTMPIALLMAASAVGLGLYVMVQPGDIANPGAPIVALVILIIPGLLLILALVTPKSLRWFLQRGSGCVPDRERLQAP
jgi:peptidoglycan/LPS O-acetylase OafA/YrhL